MVAYSLRHKQRTESSVEYSQFFHIVFSVLKSSYNADFIISVCGLKRVVWRDGVLSGNGTGKMFLQYKTVFKSKEINSNTRICSCLAKSKSWFHLIQIVKFRFYCIEKAVTRISCLKHNGEMNIVYSRNCFFN